MTQNIADNQRSLQEIYAHHSTCFGCGPSNERGLKIRTMVHFDERQELLSSRESQGDFLTTALWKADAHHEAFPGMLNGGIIGALLDCHSNWTAAYALMKQSKNSQPPCTVTADFHVKLKRPTPSQDPVLLQAKILEIKEDRARVYAELISNQKVCATCEGWFVAVKEGHPAFHRW
jgi:acyl-coenzyme A thioesterase PaaI-like protein